MSTNRTLSILILGLVALVAFTGCTREITTVVSETPEPASCMECHGDGDLGIIAITTQWENSTHASGNNTNRNGSSCARCHTGDGFLQFAAGEEVTTAVNPSVIHCFVCHAPHSEGNFGLRITEPQELVEGMSADLGAGNLCVACHQARRSFGTYFNGSSITSTHWGPHYGVMGDVLNQQNGYRYDGYVYRDAGGHRGAEDACVACHVRTGGQNWIVGGHSFNMAAEIPGAVGEDPTFVITTESCEGCHDGYDQDDFDLNGRQTEVDTLFEELGTLLTAAGMMTDGHPTAGFNVADMDSAGALWNYRTIEQDQSRGIHNVYYTIDLLQSSIDFLSGGAK